MLVLTYMLLILLAYNPFAFGVRTMTDPKAVVLILSVFFTTAVIPGFGLIVMKPLGLIQSIHLDDRQDRTGPYIISGIFFLWLFKNLNAGGVAPELFSKFVLGATIGLFLDFFINIFIKISAHATGMGGMVAMLLVTGLTWNNTMFELPIFGGILQFSMMALLAVGIVLAGLVGSARLALAAHTPVQLYLGYVVGFVAVLVASWMF
jgi:hypothetical protein